MEGLGVGEQGIESDDAEALGWKAVCAPPPPRVQALCREGMSRREKPAQPALSCTVIHLLVPGPVCASGRESKALKGLHFSALDLQDVRKHLTGRCDAPWGSC